MRFKRRKRPDRTRVLLVAGAAVAGVAAIYGISRLLRSGPVSSHLDRRRLEQNVVKALLNDDVAKTQGIDIASVGPGIIEVSGTVRSQQDARHVVELIDGVAGVHAVVNRLDIPSLDSRLERNRKRNEGERARWYGGSVGIGKRRQGFETEPNRPDDSIEIRSRALQPNRDDVLTDVEESEGTGVRIGMTNSSAFSTHVAPRSPNSATDAPPEPSSVDQSEPR